MKLPGQETKPKMCLLQRSSERCTWAKLVKSLYPRTSPSPGHRSSRLEFRVRLGAGPARTHERDLVDKVRNVVGHIELHLGHAAFQVTEEVAERVDGPTDGDDEAHGVVGTHDGRAAFAPRTPM